MGPKPKKRCGFFLLKSKMANTQKLKLDIQTVQMDGPIIGYVRIFEWPFEPWWQFRPNLTQKNVFWLNFPRIP